MNYFKFFEDFIVKAVEKLAQDSGVLLDLAHHSFSVERPKDQKHGDISTNVAMVLSKINKTSPLELAEKLAPEIKNKDSEIETISVAKPGFINIKFKPSYWSNFIKNITYFID